MNNNNKILISLAMGLAIGTVLGIVLAGEKNCTGKIHTEIMKTAETVLGSLSKKSSKRTSLKEDIEQAVKEAFAEDPEEYA